MSSIAEEKRWRIGEVARSSGVSIRTLRFYDEIGLLKPSGRAGNGYRFYAGADLARLGRICALRSLGFSLEEIKSAFANVDFDFSAIVDSRLKAVREHIEAQRQLQRRLELMQQALNRVPELSLDELHNLTETLKMIEKHYTPEQMEYLAQRRELLGEETIKNVENEWPQLIARARAAMESGEEPTSPNVQAIARRWHELVEMFTGGDPGIRTSLQNTYNEAHETGQSLGPDPSAMPSRELMEFIGRAMAAMNS